MKPPLIIVQARFNSTRLPGKVLLPIKGKPLLGYLIERMAGRMAVVASPDVEVCRFALEHSDRAVFFDTESGRDNVAGRFERVLEAFQGTASFIRLCGDSPLMDAALIDAAIALYEPPYLEIQSPVGCVEVCDTGAFLASLPEMTPHEREHVTLRLRPAGRTILAGHGPRLVVDWRADFDRVAAVIEKMGDRPHTEFGWRECMELACRQ